LHDMPGTRARPLPCDRPPLSRGAEDTALAPKPDILDLTLGRPGCDQLPPVRESVHTEKVTMHDDIFTGRQRCRCLEAKGGASTLSSFEPDGSGTQGALRAAHAHWT